MTPDELKDIKTMALLYSDPIRGKILALIAEVEVLNSKLGRFVRRLEDSRDFLRLEEKWGAASVIDDFLYEERKHKQ